MLIDLDSSRLLFKRTTTTLPDNDLEGTVADRCLLSCTVVLTFADFDELDETPRQKEKNVMLGKPKFLRLLAAGYYSVRSNFYLTNQKLKIVAIGESGRVLPRREHCTRVGEHFDQCRRCSAAPRTDTA